MLPGSRRPARPQEPASGWVQLSELPGNAPQPLVGQEHESIPMQAKEGVHGLLAMPSSVPPSIWLTELWCRHVAHRVGQLVRGPPVGGVAIDLHRRVPRPLRLGPLQPCCAPAGRHWWLRHRRGRRAAACWSGHIGQLGRWQSSDFYQMLMSHFERYRRPEASGRFTDVAVEERTGFAVDAGAGRVANPNADACSGMPGRLRRDRARRRPGGGRQPAWLDALDRLGSPGGHPGYEARAGGRERPRRGAAGGRAEFRSISRSDDALAVERARSRPRGRGGRPGPAPKRIAEAQKVRRRGWCVTMPGGS